MKLKLRVMHFTKPRSGLSNGIKAYSLIRITAAAVVCFVEYVIGDPPPETYSDHCAVREISASGLRNGDRIDIEILAARNNGETAIRLAIKRRAGDVTSNLTLVPAESGLRPREATDQ